MPVTMMRRPAVEAATGHPRSTIYAMLGKGLLPPPVRIGATSVAWISSEIDRVNAARAAGWPEDKIKQLVTDLVAARTSDTSAEAA